MARILNDDELQELTGYKSPEKVAATLRRQGIGFVSDKDGRVRTTWTAVNAVLIGGQTAVQPDLSSL